MQIILSHRQIDSLSSGLLVAPNLPLSTETSPRENPVLCFCFYFFMSVILFASFLLFSYSPAVVLTQSEKEKRSIACLSVDWLTFQSWPSLWLRVSLPSAGVLDLKVVRCLPGSHLFDVCLSAGVQRPGIVLRESRLGRAGFAFS